MAKTELSTLEERRERALKMLGEGVGTVAIQAALKTEYDMGISAGWLTAQRRAAGLVVRNRTMSKGYKELRMAKIERAKELLKKGWGVLRIQKHLKRKFKALAGGVISGLRNEGEQQAPRESPPWEPMSKTKADGIVDAISADINARADAYNAKDDSSSKWHSAYLTLLATDDLSRTLRAFASAGLSPVVTFQNGVTRVEAK